MMDSFDIVLVMFSQDKAGKVGHFGLWSEETSDLELLAHAFSILRDAVERCAEQDMRTDDVKQALAFVRANITRKVLCDHFRKALDLHDPSQRYEAVHAAYNALVRTARG